jgi:hypothetical protein
VHIQEIASRVLDKQLENIYRAVEVMAEAIKNKLYNKYYPIEAHKTKTKRARLVPK